MSVTVDDILGILKAVAPMVINSYATRLKNAAISEFVRTIDPPQKERYEFPDGDQQEINWTHFLLGDDVVIGIGKRGERIKKVRRLDR